MSINFRNAQLSELYDFQYGTGNTIENIGGEYPIYGSNGIVGFTNKFNSEDAPVIGHIGAYAGIVNWANGKHFVTYNGVICKIKPNINPRFGYYSLLNSKLQSRLRGSTQPFVSYDLLNEVKTYLPHKEIQDKIAKVLSDLDAKIELNNKINRELEAMAKTLYDYWFVQFDFPDKNGKPYKSSGGKMIWNEELKRQIPEGWKTENISKCCSIIDCLHSKKPDYKFEQHKYYLLQLENLKDDGLINISKKYFVSAEDYKNWTSRIEVKEHDIVITNAGRVGATAQIPKDIIAGIGRNITAIRPLSNSPTYLFLSFRGIDMIRQIKWNTDQGAFFTSLNVKGIKQLHVVRPPKAIEEKFEKNVLAIRKRREIVQSQNQHLTALRDWLLPMLMNGQVTVREAEESYSMVAEPGTEYESKTNV